MSFKLCKYLDFMNMDGQYNNILSAYNFMTHPMFILYNKNVKMKKK